jgi:energy-coupling factor transporter ATP-binding protein EcfA2
MSDVDRSRLDARLERSMRARQLSAMFDVPEHDESEREWHGDVPLDERDWNVGLIVGPSGAGKSTVARHLFGLESSRAGTASASSTTSRRRLDGRDRRELPSGRLQHDPGMAAPVRRALDRRALPRRAGATHDRVAPDRPLLVDEFTSRRRSTGREDRRARRAEVGPAQRAPVRRSLVPLRHRRLAASRLGARTRHHDASDGSLFDPTAARLHDRARFLRSVAALRSVPLSDGELHRSARCFVLFVDDEPAAFAGVLHRPHATLDERQGLVASRDAPRLARTRAAFVLSDALGAAYKRSGLRFHTYPAHPALIHGYDRSPMYAMTQAPGGAIGTRTGATSSTPKWRFGRRPNAVFEYVGPAAERDDWLHADPRTRSLTVTNVSTRRGREVRKCSATRLHDAVRGEDRQRRRQVLVHQDGKIGAAPKLTRELADRSSRCCRQATTSPSPCARRHLAPALLPVARSRRVDAPEDAEYPSCASASRGEGASRGAQRRAIANAARQNWQAAAWLLGAHVPRPLGTRRPCAARHEPDTDGRRDAPTRRSVPRGRRACRSVDGVAPDRSLTASSASARS